MAAITTDWAPGGIIGQRGRRKEGAGWGRRAVALFRWEDPGLGKMGPLQGCVNGGWGC